MAEKDNNQQQGNAQPVVASQQPQPRPCPQDCRLCGMNQQMYCSTQMLFNLSRAFQELHQKLSLMEMTLDDIKEQLQPKTEQEQLSIPFSE